eukprot:2885785-Rhodomonas_salina.1
MWVWREEREKGEEERMGGEGGAGGRAPAQPVAKHSRRGGRAEPEGGVQGKCVEREQRERRW